MRVLGPTSLLLACLAGLEAAETAEPDSPRALRKLEECVSPTSSKSGCLFDVEKPCTDALKMGLSPGHAAEAHKTIAARALWAVRLPARCLSCYDSYDTSGAYLARTLCRDKSYQEARALSHLKEALHLQPDYAKARSGLVHFFLGKKNLAEAYRLAKEGVERQPGRASAHALLA